MKFDEACSKLTNSPTLLQHVFSDKCNSPTFFEYQFSKMANSPAFYKSAAGQKFNSPTIFKGWASIFENSAAFLKTSMLGICNSLTHWRSDACIMCNCRILQNMISFSPQPKAKRKRRCCSPHSEKQKIYQFFRGFSKLMNPSNHKTGC